MSEIPYGYQSYVRSIVADQIGGEGTISMNVSGGGGGAAAPAAPPPFVRRH
ncbi:hypothetical protein MMH89_03000 [Candidatus Comchoanobacter bicostacola]|uniref:Uncharacterized protein n=1 Tax=Candidatus Comchoanobacter bicostacola TaxID=2919598 RepID=A0ABY5DK50_9GAMM|nr:hypothetical protein [Candidatus Comchoanobacter bicostacola]UTC24190.1 hypothetical protein MMH89_03000 [Candidatus Comchoanobacter bicostacola]